MLQERVVETEKPNHRKPAIVISNVTKEFIIPHERKVTLFENIKGLFQHSTFEKFTALDNVSFIIERGESVGIIGDNGSGKSTMLKTISKILRPTSGSIEVNGKITPFLELGVGFQPDLTAKENIAVYSTIMGLSEKEITRNTDAVLDFAGLVKFKDTKLKNFSSGMQVRLAFATAIQKEPEILLVDEVLAVGDMDFQQKCLDIFADYKRKGVTIVFVSHDLGAVRRFCDRTVLMRQGCVVADGKTPDVIDRYVYGRDKPDHGIGPVSQDAATNENTGVGAAKEEIAAAAVSNSAGVASELAPAPASAQPKPEIRWGNGKVTITGVRILDKYGKESALFHTGDTLTIGIGFRAVGPVDDPVFGIAVYNEEGVLYYGSNTDLAGLAIGSISGEGNLAIKIPKLTFISGKYLLTVAAHAKDHVPYDWHDKLYTFRVVNTSNIIGLVDLGCEWSVGSGKSE